MSSAWIWGKEEIPRKYKWAHTAVTWSPGRQELISGSLAPVSTVPDIVRAAECLLLNKPIHLGTV